MKKAALVAIFFFCHTACLFSKGIEKPDSYHKNSDLQWEWATSSIDQYSWHGNERILDVGCGNGKITALLVDKARKGIVVGLDVSSKMIDFASKNYPPGKYPNLIFMQGDALNIPFTDQFDAAVSFCALHWVLDQKKALEEIAKSLKTGGKALLVVPGKARSNISPLAEQLVKTKKWASHFPNFKPQRIYFNANEYGALLSEAGLEPISIQTTVSVNIYQNRQALVEWLKPLANFISRLPEKEQADFLNDLADAMLEVDPMHADGTIHIRSEKIEAIAIKKI